MKPLRLAGALAAFLAFAPTLASADDRTVCERRYGPARAAAIEACSRILEGDFNDRERALALVNRGLAYGTMDRERAIADLEAAIALQPDLARAWWARGYFRQYSRDIRNDPELRQRIIADYSRAIELAPNETEYYYYRGRIYSDYERDYQRAIADYSRMIELNPRHVAAHHARANAYKHLGDFQRQIADLTEIVGISPSTSAYIDRGVAYLGVKDYEKAEADFIE